MEKVKKIWERNGFPGAARLWEILKKNGLSREYKRADIVKYIGSQKVSQLHSRPVKVKHSYITTTAPGVMFCIDLLDMTAYSHDNGGMKWLLLCIDIFTRAAAIIPVKNKTAPVVAEALEEACIYLGAIPKIILSDQGSEFKGATAKFMDKNNIIHKMAEVGDHNRLGLVDRFSGVVKGWIAKFMTYHQSKRYVDDLPDMVKQYNNSPHSSLGGLTPTEAWKYPSAARDYHYEKIVKGLSKHGKSKGAIAVGDWVRIMKLRDVFHKGYKVRFSLTPHRVVKINGLNYTLDNGKFYRAARLLKIPPPEEEAADLEDVAEKARVVHRTKVKLKTEGIEPQNVRRSNRERKPESQVEDVRYGKINWK